MYKRYLAIAAFMCAAPAMAADEPSAAGRAFKQMQDAFERGKAGDAKTCLKISRGVVSAPKFALFSTEFRAWSYTVAALCANDAGDGTAALRFAMQGTALDGAPPELWRIRILRQMQDKLQTGAAVAGFEEMGRRVPDILNALPQEWIYSFYRVVKKGPDAGLRRRLLDVLAAKSYEPAEVGSSTDYFRSELAVIRAVEGDRAGATALIAMVTQPSTLLKLSVDPRTRALLPANFDLRAITERELAHRRDVAASHPASLYAVIEVANALRWLGRHSEALAGLEAASPDLPAAAAFTDGADKRNWWWDAVGYANAYLGRYDAAIAAFRHGVDAKERGGINVSQTINLAGQQLIFGRNQDAIATLAPLGEGKSASPYGIMQLIGVRGCAKFRTGDRAGADQDYAYAKAHDADAPDTLTNLALCRNDLDEAAASLVRRLDDSERRVDALLSVSDYDPPPPTYPKQVEDDRLETVKARPDVQAAISRAGGARRFPLAAAPF